MGWGVGVAEGWGGMRGGKEGVWWVDRERGLCPCPGVHVAGVGTSWAQRPGHCPHPAQVRAKH